MAYSISNPPNLVSQRVGADGGAIWVLKTTDDAKAVTAADYISDGYDLGLKAGDKVIHIDTTNGVIHELRVASVTANGAASLAGGSFELTASGAVPAGVSVVELNHASVAVAATIADSLAYAGKMLVVKDTSASGTAAHTCTLTSGTWDGTNTVVTLNAPNKAIAVFFDSAGNGTIIENVGVVALS